MIVLDAKMARVASVERESCVCVCFTGVSTLSKKQPLCG